MAESAPRNLRKIALEKNQTKPAGEPKGCGICGLPTKLCQCSSRSVARDEPNRTQKSGEMGRKSWR